MKIFSILFLSLFLVSLVSANGLQITSNNSFDIIKEQDINKIIKLTIYNSEDFDFYNINFEDNNVITMTEIPVLLPGESINITATLNQDNKFNGEIKIRGDYNTTIGASNETEIIRISYDNGIDKCNLDLIKGDTVIWINEDLDNIKLKNTDTNENYFTIINENENYTRTFTQPIVLNYLAIWVVPITEICQINVQNDEGLVHKSEYDTKINLNLLINYKNTILETSFLTTSYSIDYNQQKSDTFVIRNIGTETAKEIKLTSDNIIFSSNDFDLAVGGSINIDYEIISFVTKTEETNKTYNEIIRIEGNFETLSQNISIYIKYANLDNILSEGGEIDFTFWKNTLTLLCKAYPNEPEIKEFCQKSINYGGLNSTRQLGEGWELIFLEKYGEDLMEKKDYRTSDLESKKTAEDILKNQTMILESLKAELEENNKNSENSSMVSLFLIILVGSGIFFPIMWILIRKKLKELKINKELELPST